MKHVLDIILAVVILLLVWWVILLSMLAVKLEEPHAPIFFIQKRVGKDHRVFKMYKLRTMRAEISDGNHHPTQDNLTRCGKQFRKLSIDELPQLFNILLGHMSLVGPRPMPVEYLPYFTQEEDKRHTVRPGITGLAQLNGRTNLGWDERFAYDVQYVKNISFLADCKIILATFSKVLSSEDVSPISGVNFDDHRKSSVNEGLYKKEDLLLYSQRSLIMNLEEQK